MGIGAFSSAIRQKPLRNGGYLVKPEKSRRFRPAQTISRARQTSYRHCWSGHAKESRAIERPESSGERSGKWDLNLIILLKIKRLQRRLPWAFCRILVGVLSPKPYGEKPYHQVRTPFPRHWCQRGAASSQLGGRVWGPRTPSVGEGLGRTLESAA